MIYSTYNLFLTRYLAFARSFIANALLDLLTIVAFFDRLKVVQALRRICVFERFHAILNTTRSSPVFGEFTALELQLRVHEAQIHSQLGNHIIRLITQDHGAVGVRHQGVGRRMRLIPRTVLQYHDRGSTGTDQIVQAPREGGGVELD
jgi:hypothetical protein